MLRCIFTCVVVALAHVSFSQSKLDSTRTILKKAYRTGDKKYIAYWQHALAYQFSQLNNYDSALKYYYQVASSKIEDKRLLAETLNAIGVIYSDKDFLDSSTLYYSNALELFKSIGDTVTYPHLAANLAIIYKDQGLYQKSLDVAFEAVRDLEKLEPSRELASCLNTIASVYKKMDDTERALEFHKKALAIRKTLGLTRNVAQSLNNIGETLMTLGHYDSALIYLNDALAVKRALGDPKALPVTLNNLGITYQKQNKLEEAQKAFNEALGILRQQVDRAGLVSTLNNLGGLYIGEGKFAPATPLVTEAETLARQIGSLDLMSESLALKLQLLKNRNDFKTALKYSEELKMIQDSLMGIEKVEAMLSVQAKYESEKKEQEIALLNEKDKAAQAELEAQQWWIISLVIGCVLIAIIAFLILALMYTEKKRKRYAERLLREMHHRVKNNLQILSSLLTLQSQELTDEKALEAVKTSEGRVNAMALIHKKLYNAEQNREINLKEYVTELVSYLVYSYGFAKRELKLDLRIEQIQLDVDKAIPLGLILNELVSNAFKHAFVDHESPELCINVIKQHDKALVLHIQDNGKFPPELKKENFDSYGMKMVDLLTRDLRGTLSISNGKGTGFSLNIPLA